jgi:hypothetical protein
MPEEDSPRYPPGRTAQNGRPWPDGQECLLTDEAGQRDQQWKWDLINAAQLRRHAGELANLVSQKPSPIAQPNQAMLSKKPSATLKQIVKLYRQFHRRLFQ